MAFDPIPHPHRCDVWEPTEQIETSGVVDTPTYARRQSGVRANFQSRGRGKRMFSGLDVTQKGTRLYLYGTLVEPSDRALFVNRTDRSVWRSDGPSEWYQTAVSAGHFEVDLTRELTPPDEVTAAYP